MRKGEKVVWGLTAIITASALYVGYVVYNAPAKVMPTYQVESAAAAQGEAVYRRNACDACHRIWDVGGHQGGVLDGIGSRRSEQWLTAYLSADNPQAILPSQVKKFFQMPSFASMPETDRADLVAFLFSLKDRQLEVAAPPQGGGDGR
ncbi:MAG: cytochrome c [Nitrospirae bacterium]|nr:cytochrome c [Nitrospirota bacterium]